MTLEAPGEPLRAAEVPIREPGPEQVLLQVRACAVCRTDLHVVDGELPDPKLPLIPGHQIDGGYAEYVVADHRFCFPIPEGCPDLQAAPLLCAGLIGYRSLRMVGDAERLGLYGFGAAAHIIAQLAVHEGRRVFAFTRDGDVEAQAFARELGAEWAGSGAPPEELDAAIIFAPAGELIPAALRAIA